MVPPLASVSGHDKRELDLIFERLVSNFRPLSLTYIILEIKPSFYGWTPTEIVLIHNRNQPLAVSKENALRCLLDGEYMLSYLYCIHTVWQCLIIISPKNIPVARVNDIVSEKEAVWTISMISDNERWCKAPGLRFKRIRTPRFTSLWWFGGKWSRDLQKEILEKMSHISNLLPQNHCERRKFDLAFEGTNNILQDLHPWRCNISWWFYWEREAV